MGRAGNEETDGSAPYRVGARAGEVLANERDVTGDVPRDSEPNPGSPGYPHVLSMGKTTGGRLRPKRQTMVKPLLEANTEVGTQRQNAGRGT